MNTWSRVTLAWVSVLLSVGALSCNKVSSVPAPMEETFLPGECLNSSALIFSNFLINDYTEPNGFVFSFIMDMDCEFSRLGSPWASRDYRYLPTDDVFNAFVDNCPSIKELYEDAWHEVIESRAGLCFSSSIFYDSGINLTANKEFAGFPAGDNIASSVLFDSPVPANTHSIPVGNSFTYNYYLPRVFALRIPINDFDIVDEDITFTLSIPVKVGLYLTWLSNRLTDPDAPFPYREETLTCTFTAHKGLHKK